MYYFIGGPGRCGKTTLARMLRGQVSAQSLSLDAMITALRSTTTPETHPALFHKIVDPVTFDDPPQRRIDRYYWRDKEMWKFLRSYIHGMRQSGDNLIVEGCLWPSSAHEFDQEHRAVFLVDTSINHVERLIHIRDNSVHDNWMKEEYAEDSLIEKWAQFNIVRSQFVIQECEKYGYPYFDVGELGIENAQQRALAWLVEGKK